jgi:hypothetical protein
MSENKFKIATIFDGIIIPIILVLLIFIFAVYLNVQGTYHVLGASNLIAIILVSGFAQMIVLGIPLVLGLLWNKWDGAAAGFVMGGIYCVASAGEYTSLYAAATGGTITYNFFGDVSMLFYLVNAIIIGYMAGALNNGSTNFKRMLISGLTAAIITAIIQTYMNYNVSLDPAKGMAQSQWATDPVNAVIINFVPGIALGVIVPILGKVMTWYGLQPMRHQ